MEAMARRGPAAMRPCFKPKSHHLKCRKNTGEECMQTLTYTIGNWRAEAQIEEVESGKLMAVISVKNEEGAVPAASKHTVVFDHEQGKDKGEETKLLVHRLLKDRYGM
jgi:hypothetical protein